MMLSRRAFLASASVVALAGPAAARAATEGPRVRAEPVPHGASLFKLAHGASNLNRSS